MSVKKEANGRRSVQVEVEVPGTPEQVWQAIATGPGVGAWFVPTEVDGRIGGTVTSHFGGGMDSVATITEWDPPHRFVDTQLKGPYSQWIHKHTFTEIDANTTLIEDEVRYRLPLEPLGDLFHFIVVGELKKVFDYREKVVAKELQKPDR